MRNFRTEKSKFELDKFLELIHDERKMSNYVTAARNNSILDQLFIVGLNESATALSLRLGRAASFNCFGTTPSIPSTLLKFSACAIRGRTVGPGDTTVESPVLSMTFRRDIPPYTQEIFQWRHADNDPCSASETMQATDFYKLPTII